VRPSQLLLQDDIRMTILSIPAEWESFQWAANAGVLLIDPTACTLVLYRTYKMWHIALPQILVRSRAMHYMWLSSSVKAYAFVLSKFHRSTSDSRWGNTAPLIQALIAVLPYQPSLWSSSPIRRCALSQLRHVVSNRAGQI
jgi:hypothetical protein